MVVLRRDIDLNGCLFNVISLGLSFKITKRMSLSPTPLLICLHVLYCLYRRTNVVEFYGLLVIKHSEFTKKHSDRSLNSEVYGGK